MKRFLYEKRRILCPLSAFMIPVAVMVFISILSGFYPFGNTSILMADMRYQFVDYFGYMKQIFFGNDTYFYSFAKTLGGDMAGLAAYYCNNPFLLFLLFVPNDLLPGGILIMMIIMLGFIGLTFNIFLTEVYGSRYTTLIFSTAYAFMGYLMGYFNCVHYFFNIMMLPLVMLGIFRTIKNERISILYIISQALSVFSCYYIGYMICIFSVFYFIYCYFIVNDDIKSFRDVKQHAGSIYLFISSSIFGVGLSAVSLFCSVISLRSQSSRKHIPLSLKGNFNLTELFSGFYSTAFHGNVSDGLPLIYSGVAAVLFILAYFLCNAISRKEKIISGSIFIFLILGFYIDFLNVFWHGFSYPIGFPYRESFLFSFWVLFLAYKSFLSIENIRKKQIIIISFIYVIYSIYMGVILNENVGARQIIITGVYIIASFVLIFMYKRKILFGFIMPAFFILMLTDVSYNAYISINSYFPGKEEDNSITITAFKDFVDETTSMIRHLEAEDDGFYRVEKLYRRSNNDAMLIGYNGLSHFSSCEAEASRRFMGSLGFRDNDNWAYYGEGSTTFADCILGVKYLLSQYNETPKPYYETVYGENDKRVFINPYALPLCFTMSRDCLETDPSIYDHFSYQNALARCFGYEGDDIYRSVEDVNISLNNLEKTGNVYKAADPEKDAFIEFDFINTSEDFIFMYFDADSLQDTRIVINDLEKQPYFTSYGWSIRELGHYNEGEKVNVRIYADQDEISLNGYEFYYEDKQAIAAWYEAATQNECRLIKQTSSHLLGTVNSKEQQELVFSFPYDEQWRVYVDGQRAENKIAAAGLLCVDIEKGTHTIELKYVPKGFVIGFPVSFMAFIVLLVILKHRKRIAM